MNLILASAASLLRRSGFFAAKRCIEDKKHTRRVLGHVNLFKSLVSEINLLHWLDNTAVLCTNYYCSDSSSRTKIWLDGAHHRKSDKKAGD